LVSEFRLTAGCVLMDLASPAASQAAVYANGLTPHMLVVFVHRTVVNACNITIQLKPLCPGQ